MYKAICRKIYPLLSNSFFDDFNFISLTVFMDILKLIFDYIFNAQEARNYLVNTKEYNISNKLIMDFYIKISKYIYLYYIIEY